MTKFTVLLSCMYEKNMEILNAQILIFLLLLLINVIKNAPLIVEIFYGLIALKEVCLEVEIWQSKTLMPIYV